MRLLKFESQNCMPCKKIEPILQQVAEHLKLEIQKIDVERDYKIASHYLVRSLPTLMLVNEEGLVLWQYVGTISRVDLLSKLKTLIGG